MRIKLLFACIDMDLGEAWRMEVERESGGDIACALTDVARLFTAAAAIEPDVLLLEECLEHPMPDALACVSQCTPETRVIMLYESCTQDRVIESIARGASGYLLKSCDPALVVRAVAAVFNGETWYGRNALLEALKSRLRGSPPPSTHDEGRLTQREEEILHHIGSGLTNKEIGRRLDISDKTVKTHLHHIYVKLNRSGRYKAYLSQAVASSATGLM